MKDMLAKPLEVIETRLKVDGVRIGRIMKIDEGGEIWVDYPGNPYEPIPARKTSSIEMGSEANQEVLLVFENNDPNLPIIIDTIYSPLNELLGALPVSVEADKPENVIIDGKRVVFSAEEEILLKCGKGSISLKKDGKVVVRGTKLISRSSGINKIKGGAVHIN